MPTVQVRFNSSVENPRWWGPLGMHATWRSCPRGRQNTWVMGLCRLTLFALLFFSIGNHHQQRHRRSKSKSSRSETFGGPINTTLPWGQGKYRHEHCHHSRQPLRRRQMQPTRPRSPQRQLHRRFQRSPRQHHRRLHRNVLLPPTHADRSRKVLA